MRFTPTILGNVESVKKDDSSAAIKDIIENHQACHHLAMLVISSGIINYTFTAPTITTNQSRTLTFFSFIWPVSKIYLYSLISYGCLVMI